MFDKFYSDFIRVDEPDAQITSSLAPRPGEPVLLKNTYDAFLHTDLEEILKQSGATQIVLCGVLTHMCCETTARSAFCRGFEVYLPVDALATTLENRHVASLKSMADAVGVPLCVAAVEDACRAASS
jgi:isochorismate hydrolase